MITAAVAFFAQLALHQCAIEGTASRCGTLTVPETPGGRPIALSVIVFQSVTRGREPLFVLAGGPGQAVTNFANGYAHSLRSVQRRRDVVFIDQRGTGGANRLDCAVAPRTFFVPMDTERCLARLQQRVDLTAYGTANFVDDLEAARSALGYERISLYGASYGTRAAVAYARKYPARVVSLVLVAPAPFNLSTLDDFDAPEETDPFYALGTTFLRYSSETAPVLKRDRATIEAAIESVRAQLLDQLAMGLHLTINCSEELPFGSKDTIARREYARACRGWPRYDVPAAFHGAERLDKSALIIAGKRDPITSPRWARVEAEQFTRSQVVIVPKMGHLFPGLERCIGDVAAEFLDRGKSAAACLH